MEGPEDREGGEQRSARSRPWISPFATIVRNFLSCFRNGSSSPPALRRQTSPPPQLANPRYVIYNRSEFSALNPDSRRNSAMDQLEAGKRIGHVSVCFDGKLVIWGGYNDGQLHRNFPSNELWVYDPLIQKWSLWTCVESKDSNDLPPGTSGATSCLLGSYMYIFGGYTAAGNVNTIYRIDLSPLSSSDVYSCSDREKVVSAEKIQPLNGDEAPIPSDKHVSWSHEGRFYVFGGYGYEPQRSDRYQRLMPRASYFLPDTSSQWQSPGQFRRGWNNQLACFDPGTNKWSYPNVKGQWPVPRAAHAAAKLKSQVLIFGGRHDRNRVNDLWMLDMNSMTWSEVKSDFSPEGRSWHSLTAISDEEVLLFGGLSNSRQPLADCFVFNSRLGKWLTVSVRSEARLWHSAVFSCKDQQVFIYGGGTDDILDHSFKTSEIYTNDLITMRFSPDSLLRLCLDACANHADSLKSQFIDLPSSLWKILFLRTAESASPVESGY